MLRIFIATAIHLGLRQVVPPKQFPPSHVKGKIGRLYFFGRPVRGDSPFAGCLFLFHAPQKKTLLRCLDSLCATSNRPRMDE